MMCLWRVRATALKPPHEAGGRGGESIALDLEALLSYLMLLVFIQLNDRRG